jgi:N-acetyl-anhydromuramyl-L-alanine amidase AmpD
MKKIIEKFMDSIDAENNNVWQRMLKGETKFYFAYECLEGIGKNLKSFQNALNRYGYKIKKENNHIIIWR